MTQAALTKNLSAPNRSRNYDLLATKPCSIRSLLKVGSSTNLFNSVARFAYCSVFVFQANVMPHPPLRSRPTSAGATRTRPSSAGRERITGPPVARGNYHHHYHHYYHPAFSVGMLWIMILFHAFQSDIVLARSSLLILEFFKIRSVNEHGHLIFFRRRRDWMIAP